MQHYESATQKGKCTQIPHILFILLLVPHILLFKGTFSGQARPFIKILLTSVPKVSASELLSEVNYGTVKQFISSLAHECNLTEVKDVNTAGIIIAKQMNAISADTWKTCLESKLIVGQSTSSNSNNSLFCEGGNIVSPIPQAQSITVWSFMGNTACPVYQLINEKIICVDIKDFTAYSIRNVDLQLQLNHNSHKLGSVFRVDRFSKEEGTLDSGKFLNGKFQGHANVDKVSHSKFVIQEEASPEN